SGCLVMLCRPVTWIFPMRDALVFGGSGQIGSAVLARLQASGWRVAAVSRNARAGDNNAADGAIRWLRGELDAPPALPPRVDATFSCGPLDAFARWCARAGFEAARVLASGTTSLETTQTSEDPFERDPSTRLANAEQALFEHAAQRGAGLTVLRPTLVYGVGR